MVVFISSAVLSPISRLYLRLICWRMSWSILSPPTRTDRLGYGEPSPDCGRHRLFYQVDLMGAGRFSGLPNGPFFDLRHARGNTDYYSWPDKGAPVVHFAYEVSQHCLGYFKIRDHAIFHRPDRSDIAGSLSEH